MGVCVCVRVYAGKGGGGGGELRQETEAVEAEAVMTWDGKPRVRARRGGRMLYCSDWARSWWSWYGGWGGRWHLPRKQSWAEWSTVLGDFHDLLDLGVRVSQAKRRPRDW